MIPALVANEEITSIDSACMIGPEIIGPSKNVHVDGAKAKTLSRGGTKARDRSKPGVDQEAKRRSL